VGGKTIFVAVELKRGKYRNWGEGGGKGCMYIKDWFKPIFPHFVSWPPRKFKFLVRTVDIAPMLISEVRVWRVRRMCVCPSVRTRFRIKGPLFGFLRDFVLGDALGGAVPRMRQTVSRPLELLSPS
jgi:hypothetical protein